MKIIDFFNLSPTEIEENINSFIKNNSNEQGIDSSKVYLACLSYIKPSNRLISYGPKEYQSNFGINCPINEINDYNKATIVYILKSQGKHDHVFIDIFNKTILQSTVVEIPGLLSTFSEVREGVTVSEYSSIKDILDINRLKYQDIENIYNNISKCDIKEVLSLTKNELSETLLLDSNRKNKGLTKGENSIKG